MERQPDPRSRIGGGGPAAAPPNAAAAGRRGRPQHQIAGLYDLEETIGEGHYAVVKLARHVFTGEKVAVKVIDKSRLDAATRTQMLQEVQLMKLVQHPHVVRLYEVIDTASKLYLVLEFADGGDMYDYIMRHEGGLGEEQARKYFTQIVTAIQYCHRLHVVHRDLKPENVVFFERLGIVKLTDFGFSNQFDPGQRLQTSCGSLAYSAPEILLGDAYDAPAVDIWSLGVILYMLVCGSAPFQEANDSETLTMIMDCKYSFPKHISQQCKRLIARMLQRQPDQRATLDDIVNDPWLGGAADSEGNAISSEDQLPMVSREHLTEEEHAYILKKMVGGGIAEKDEIIAALDCNEYNHVTATYFLLAERLLSAQRDALARQLRQRRAARRSVTAEVVTAAAAAAGSSPSKRGIVADVEEEISSAGAFTHRRGLPDALTKQQLPSATVDSLLSPEATAAALSAASAAGNAGGASTSVTVGKRFGGGGIRGIAIVEEEDEEEEEEEEMDEVDAGARGIPIPVPAAISAVGDDDDVVVSSPARGRPLSRHSSTSSLADKSADIAAIDITTLAAGLKSFQETGAGSAPGSGTSTPAPFPVSSQIGTGGLSRQGSMRKSSGGGMAAAASSSASTPSVALAPSLEAAAAPCPANAATSAAVLSSSPASERRASSSIARQSSSSPSPSTPPGSNGSSAQGSPARYKMLPNKKLVATRSSPQLMLNQIHEEAEDGTASSTAAPSAPSGGRASSATAPSSDAVDPVDSFPTSAAAAAVIRRLEQRRRLHKARTQSCSSSDASDDDAGGEGRRRRHDKSRTSPGFCGGGYKRDSQHDDSSDSQEPGVGTSSFMASRTLAAVSTTGTKQEPSANEGGGSKSGTQSGGGGSGNTRRASTGLTSSSASVTGVPVSRRHRASGPPSSRMRQSHSLNRISELHVVADFSSDDNNNNSSCPSSVASVANGVYHPKPPLPSSGTAAPNVSPHQLLPSSLESDAEGAPFDMLTRYLESLAVVGRNRSRDDSQNSSDGENENPSCSDGGGSSSMSSSSSSRPSSARRHKVNLRVLEQRLNKIQEENNRSADEEEEEEEGEVEDDGGEISDDPSTLPDEGDFHEANARRNSLTREQQQQQQQQEPQQDPKQALIEMYDPKRFAWRIGEDLNEIDDKASIKSCDVSLMRGISGNHGSVSSSNNKDKSNNATTTTASAPVCRKRKPLLRAHSCGSLMSLKERAMLSRNLLDLLQRTAVSKDPSAAAVTAAVTAAGAADAGVSAASAGSGISDVVTPAAALTLAAAAPLTMLQLQNSSRCCNLC